VDVNHFPLLAGKTMPPQFDYQGARKEGYSDDEIISYLTRTRKFDLQGALKEGYSKPEIAKYLAGLSGKGAPTTPAPPSGPAFEIEQEHERYRKSNPIVRAVSSFESGWGIPQSVQEHPSEAVKGVGMALMHPKLEAESLREMWNSMTAEQQQLIDRAYMLQHSPGLKNKANGFVLGIYSAIPFFGPAIVHAIDQWHSNDKAGAIGSLAAVGSQLYRPKGASVAEEGSAGEMARAGAPKAPLTERITTGARRVAQGLVGSGPEATSEPLIERHRAASAKVGEENLARERAAHEANEQTWQKAKGEEMRREANYQEKVAAVQKENAAQEAQVTRRVALGKEIDTESATLGTDLKKLEHAVWQEANRRMDAVKPVGNPQAPPDTLIATVKDIETNTLQGVSENLKEFRRVLAMENTSEEMSKLRDDVMAGQGMQGMKYEDLSPERKALVDGVVERWGGQITSSEPENWGKLQSLKSRIDRRLRNTRGMNGDLKRGLFQLRDTVVDEMGKLLQQPGQSPTAVQDWQAARNFYRQFKEDFHEPIGPSGSGSPVAQALDAVDPDRIRKPFSNTESNVGNRGTATLRKYAQFGGDKVADRVRSILDRQQEYDKLPKTYTPKPLPKRPEIPKAEIKTAELENPPKQPAGEDIRAEKMKRLRDTAVSWGKLHTYDLGILASSALGPLFYGRWAPLLADPAFVAIRKSFGRILSSEAVRNWLANPLPEELNALNRLPEDLKDDARQGIREYVNKQHPRPKLDRRLQVFLEGGAISSTRKEKPAGQQIRDLQRIQERYSHNPNLPTGDTEP
jgi:hypothetical protein